MKNWLITYLGGFTKEEYISLQQLYKHQYDIINDYRDKINSSNEELNSLKNLYDDLVIKMSAPKEDQSQQPIKLSAETWGHLKSRLERDDRARVRSNA